MFFGVGARVLFCTFVNLLVGADKDGPAGAFFSGLGLHGTRTTGEWRVYEVSTDRATFIYFLNI